jgi:preprotein translocase subunit SecA
MNGLALATRRAGWSAYPERRRAADGHAWVDTQRRLRAWFDLLAAHLAPGSAARLPRAVIDALRNTETGLAQADEALFQRTVAALRTTLQRDRFTPVVTGRALAVAGAAMARTLGKTPYDSQYLAAWLILQGRLAEMATGEGKTLAAALAAAVAALAQVPVHLLTANDYLVQRDCETLAPFYAALGLSVGHVLASTPQDQRARAYRCDVTLVTPKELVFDYLKDHLAHAGEHDPRVLRARALSAAADEVSGESLLPGLHMAIVDEADACLLDEAVMPLILALPGRPVNANAYAAAFGITTRLQRGRDYQLLPAQRAARLTDAGRALVDLGVRSACAAAERGTPLAAALTTALAPPQRAHELVEAALAARWLFRRDREYTVVAPQPPSFVAGGELQPGEPGRIELIDEVTGRIADGRQWSSALQQMVEIKEGVALSAPAVPAAQITFQRFFPRYLHLGGMSGTLTEARRELRLNYGVGIARVPLARASRRRWLGETLYVNAAAKWAAVVQAVAAQHHAGRPVLVGTDSVADSAHLSGLLHRAGIAHQVLNAVQDAHEAACIAQAGRRGAVTVATNLAGRGTDIALDADADADTHADVRAAGGLHVIACMRNRARRTDRQLIGRCARQGDPGSAQRLVALDDLLLQRALPAWLRRAAARTALGSGEAAAAATSTHGRVPAWFAVPLLAWAQRSAERQEAQRRTLLRNAERRLGELFGFAGITE